MLMDHLAQCKYSVTGVIISPFKSFLLSFFSFKSFMLLTVFEGASSVEKIFILPLFGKESGSVCGKYPDEQNTVPSP